MDPKLTRAFCQAKYEADTELAMCAWNCIQSRNKRNTLIKMWSFSCIGLLSFVGLFPAIRLLAADVTQSGFYEYFSLIFSDGGLILSSWKEFLFSIGESLPLTSITLTLSLVFIFFLSLKYTSRQIIRNRLSLSF